MTRNGTPAAPTPLWDRATVSWLTDTLGVAIVPTTQLNVKGTTLVLRREDDPRGWVHLPAETVVIELARQIGALHERLDVLEALTDAP